MNEQPDIVSSTYNFGSDHNNCVTSDHTTTACPVPQACGSRLPCGVCLITNQKCPLMPSVTTITWSSSNVSNDPKTLIDHQYLNGPITSSQPEVTTIYEKR